MNGFPCPKCSSNDIRRDIWISGSTRDELYTCLTCGYSQTRKVIDGSIQQPVKYTLGVDDASIHP